MLRSQFYVVVYELIAMHSRHDRSPSRANLCSVKWRNGNSFYLLHKAEILVVVTLERLLPEATQLFIDSFQ